MQFEQLVLSNLVHDSEFAYKTLNYIKPEYFSEIGQRNAFLLIYSFYQKYKAPPTRDSLLIDLSNSNLPEAIFDPTGNAIQNIVKEENNTKWMFDESEKWAQRRGLYIGMQKAIEVMDGKDTKMSKDAIPSIIQQALAIKFDMRIGHDYIEDAKLQWDYYQNPETKIPYLLECMNRATKNGNTRGTISVVQAGIGVGKTTFLLNVAAGYAKQGLNGIYFTLEIAEEVLRERMDVMLFGETSEQIRAHEEIPYINRVKKIKEANFGKVLIKRFAAGTVHVGHLRHIVREFEQTYGVKCDFIVIDYITLMISSLLPPSMKADSNYYYTSVAEEIRALMIEFNSIGWTAQQFTRAGQDSNDPKLSSSGLSIGVQATSDFTIAIVSPSELNAQNKAQCSILKNRFNPKEDYLKFMIGLDNHLQLFFDLPEDEANQSLAKDLNDQVEQAMAMVNAEKKKDKTFNFGGIDFGGTGDISNLPPLG